MMIEAGLRRSAPVLLLTPAGDSHEGHLVITRLLPDPSQTS